jgi:hypothetical protein
MTQGSPGTGAGTHTHTRTLPRLSAIKFQVRQLMLRTLSSNTPSEQSRQGIDRGISNQWIERVGVQALNSGGKLLAELVLTIDWTKYETHISRQHTEIAIDARWPDETVIEIVAAAELFNDYVAEKSLATKWYISYRAGLDRDDINHQLGFRRATKRAWAGKPEQAVSNSVPEISEINVDLRMVFD